MRHIQHKQLQIGEVDIGSIKLDHHSRDDIPQILIGLQHIYVNTEVRDRVFALLKQAIPENINPQNGRPGMHLWNILVLAVLQVNLNWDYDRLRFCTDLNLLWDAVRKVVVLTSRYSLQAGISS